MKFEKHVFICTNQKTGGKKCCGEAVGLELVAKFKKILKDKNLNIRIRAQRAGCIDACDFGPSLVVYPEGTYYGHLTLDDVEKIIEQHLINGKVVEELELKF